MRTYVPPEGVIRARINGLELAAIERGAGPLVLLLHGFPDTAFTWDGVLQPLADAGFHAVAPFQRGYAPSALPERDTDVETLARDAVAWIEHFGGPAIVVGHDWGAMGAIGAAHLGGDKVRGLVQVAIPHPASLKPTLALAWAARHFVTLRLPGAAGRLTKDDCAGVEALWQRWSPDWDVPHAELEPVKNCFASPGSADAAIGYYRTMGKPPSAARAKIAVPTLAVAGANDMVAPSVFEGAARGYTAGYEVCVVPGGHWPHRQSPDAFRERLVQFVRGLPG